MPDDASDGLVDAVRCAGDEGRKLLVVGSGSKLGKTPAAHSASGSSRSGPAGGVEAPDGAQTLSVVAHAGVIDYRPEELVLTARSGTALREIDALLGRHRQHLPFEPPMIDGGGTLGGAVAAGWSGPGRPWRGSLRDAVLGVEMVNGLGRRLRFGGQVMKNVAGYDLSRLQAGAWGTLGILLNVSVRLAPRPPVEKNCRLECGAGEALGWMRAWARTFSPISGACHQEGVLHVRLSGPEQAVAAAAQRIGGEVSSDVVFWSKLRDQALPFFRQRGEDASRLWRIDCPPAAKPSSGPCLMDWAGGRRWWRTDLPPPAVQAYAAEIGGVASPAGGALHVHNPMTARLKQAFDPKGVLNPHLPQAFGQEREDAPPGQGAA